MEDKTQELSLINKYSQKALAEDDVYVFSVTLCDNEIDRDYERFTKKSLQKLGELFIGKTGIFDHSMKASGQTARIFKTWVEVDPAKKTSLGEPYTRLCARAYMVRTDENEALINEIEGGIKKEVSVGCAVDKIICSICGRDMKTHRCEHIKGKVYGSAVCHGILTEPNDAYEWSFVAVPSQRSAGVTKSFAAGSAPEQDAVQLIKSGRGQTVLTAEQVKRLGQYICELEEKSEQVRLYRDELMAQLKKYAMIAMPKADIKQFIAGCEGMTPVQIRALKDSLKAQSEQMFGTQAQLKPIPRQNDIRNREYKI